MLIRVNRLDIDSESPGLDGYMDLGLVLEGDFSQMMVKDTDESDGFAPDDEQSLVGGIPPANVPSVQWNCKGGLRTAVPYLPYEKGNVLANVCLTVHLPFFLFRMSFIWESRTSIVYGSKQLAQSWTRQIQSGLQP